LPKLIFQTIPQPPNYATQIIYSEIQNEIKYLYIKKQQLKQQLLLSAAVSYYAQYLKAMYSELN